MARGNGGGYQKPANPAPVSPPGALSRRTDGGPGDRQPIRTATGQPYGQAGALAAQQQQAPLLQGRPVPASGGGRERMPPPALPDAFGPTARPGEDPATGLAPTANFPDDPKLLLRYLYAMFPHPDIARLLD